MVIFGGVPDRRDFANPSLRNDHHAILGGALPPPLVGGAEFVIFWATTRRRPGCTGIPYGRPGAERTKLVPRSGNRDGHGQPRQANLN